MCKPVTLYTGSSGSFSDESNTARNLSKSLTGTRISSPGACPALASGSAAKATGRFSSMLFRTPKRSSMPQIPGGGHLHLPAELLYLGVQPGRIVDHGDSQRPLGDQLQIVVRGPSERRRQQHARRQQCDRNKSSSHGNLLSDNRLWNRNRGGPPLTLDDYPHRRVSMSTNPPNKLAVRLRKAKPRLV